MCIISSQLFCAYLSARVFRPSSLNHLLVLATCYSLLLFLFLVGIYSLFVDSLCRGLLFWPILTVLRWFIYLSFLSALYPCRCSWPYLAGINFIELMLSPCSSFYYLIRHIRTNSSWCFTPILLVSLYLPFPIFFLWPSFFSIRAYVAHIARVMRRPSIDSFVSCKFITAVNLTFSILLFPPFVRLSILFSRLIYNLIWYERVSLF